jgi:uncharacterized membrane protein YraQ (UPF0718 family)
LLLLQSAKITPSSPLTELVEVCVHFKKLRLSDDNKIYSSEKTFKMEQITYILNFILKSFIHVWPYLLVTIPLAVWMNLSDLYLTTYLRIIKKSCECSSTGTTLKELPIRKKIIRESVISVLMISKFMGLAFFLNALINLYVPEEWIGNLLNQQGFVSVIIASVLGVPIYTSNLTALPLVGGLLQLGLNPEAALAFLISGPLTTIPAMVAVYGITTRKVFGLYIFIALFGSLFFGILYYFLG